MQSIIGLKQEIDELLKNKSIKQSDKIDQQLAERFGVMGATQSHRMALMVISAMLDERK